MNRHRQHAWNPPKMCKSGCPDAARPGFTVCDKCLGHDFVSWWKEFCAALASRMEGP